MSVQFRSFTPPTQHNSSVNSAQDQRSGTEGQFLVKQFDKYSNQFQRLCMWQEDQHQTQQKVKALDQLANNLSDLLQQVEAFKQTEKLQERINTLIGDIEVKIRSSNWETEATDMQDRFNRNPNSIEY